MTHNPLTLVTGGTRGIGAAIAVRLAAEGHDLILGFHADADAADHLVGLLTGVDVVAVRADVRHTAGIDALFDAVDGRTLTGVVNNAGATLHIGDLSETPIDVICDVIALNLTSTILGCRRAVREMSTKHGGSGGAIVNVSSTAATSGSAHEYVHYAAAKAGVDALTVGLAKELGRDGIRVNAVSPGMIETTIHADAGDPGRLDRLSPQIPLGRPGRPDEIAAAVSWLLSAEAAYATGTVLRVAGGL